MTGAESSFPETTAVHAGVYQDRQYHSVTTPIYPSTTFYFDVLGESPPFDYSRSGNPTRQALQENLNALEGGAGAFAVCSGVTAIHTVLMLLKAGDHVICGRELYGGTHRLLTHMLPAWGMTVSFIDSLQPETIEAALRPQTRLIWIETPTNPLLNLVDIEAVAAVAHRSDILVAVDNTFLTPIFQRPLDFGADLVVYSTTKYLNGHSDVVGGAIVVRTADLRQRVDFLINAIGVGSAPFEAWLVLRGIKTLPQRMRAHEQNGARLAAYLEQQPAVRRVFYPGLPHHPGHAIAKKQQSGFGGMLSFEVDLQCLDMRRFFQSLRYFHLSVSLGGIESLIEQPWSMSHLAMPENERHIAGITEALFRISAGIEAPEDLTTDLERAFKAAAR